MERQVCEISRWFNEDEAAEIAYLFAAAPDLLAACRSLLSAERLADEFGVDSNETIEALTGASRMARAAIAKAGGGEK